MSSVDTLAKRVIEKGGSLDIRYCKGNATKLNYWVINMSLPKPPLYDGLYEQMVLGGLGDPLSKVANKANGALK